MRDRSLGLMLLVALGISMPFVVLFSVGRGAMPKGARRRAFGDGATPVAGAGFAYARTSAPMTSLMGPAANAMGLVPIAISLLRRKD